MISEQCQCSIVGHGQGSEESKIHKIRKVVYSEEIDVARLN